VRAQYAASQGGTLNVQGAAARAARGLKPDAVVAVTRRLCRRRACRGSGGITDGSYSTRRMEDAPSLLPRVLHMEALMDGSKLIPAN